MRRYVSTRHPETGTLYRWEYWDEMGLVNLMHTLAFYGWEKINKGKP